MSTTQGTRDSLQSAEPIPIQQLRPGVDSSRVVDGEVTITWPFSIVTRSIAFKLVESDFRLRLNKGQFRVDFHGAAAKAVADAAIGGGDEVRIGLEGVEWVESPTPPRPDTLEWQLKFTNRLCLQVRRAETKEEQVINVNVPDGGAVVEGQEPLITSIIPSIPPTPSIPTESLGPSTPKHSYIEDEIPLPKTTGPSFPVKRLASTAFDADEYASPAFLKRARVSYGSLFEGGLDPFEDQDKKPGRKKRPRFSMHANWRYTSRSPSPEPEHQAELEEVESIDDDLPNHQPPKPGNESPSPMPMVDEGCQTQVTAPDSSIPAQIAPSSIAPTQIASLERAPSPAMEVPPVSTLAPETASIIDNDTYPVPTFMAEPQATISAPQSPVARPFDQAENLLPEPSHEPSPSVFTLDKTNGRASSPVGLPPEIPVPNFSHNDQQRMGDFIHQDEDYVEPPSPIGVEPQQDLSVELDPSLTDFPRHVHEEVRFAPSQLEQAPWSTLTSLPPQPVHSGPSNLDTPVEIIDSSSPPRAPSPEAQPAAVDLRDEQPEVTIHTDEGREEEHIESLEAGYRHVEAPTVDFDDNAAERQAEIAEDDDRMQDGKSDADGEADIDAEADDDEADVAGEDYDLRNYDDAQDDDVVEPVDSSEGIVDESDPDQQVVDFEDEDEDEDEEEEEEEAQSEEVEASAETIGYPASAAASQHNYGDSVEEHYRDDESEQDYDEEKLEAEHYDEDEEGDDREDYEGEEDYEEEEEGYDEEEDYEEEEEAAPRKPIAPQEPVFISLLSDSEDEDEEPEKGTAVVPSADERDPFNAAGPRNDGGHETVAPVEVATSIERTSPPGPAPPTNDISQEAVEPEQPTVKSEDYEAQLSAEPQAEVTVADPQVAEIDFAFQKSKQTATDDQDYMDVDEPAQPGESAKSHEAPPAVDENAVSLVPTAQTTEQANQRDAEAEQLETESTGHTGEEERAVAYESPEEVIPAAQAEIVEEDTMVIDSTEGEQLVTAAHGRDPADTEDAPMSSIETESVTTSHIDATGTIKEAVTETIVEETEEVPPLKHEAEVVDPAPELSSEQNQLEVSLIEQTEAPTEDENQPAIDEEPASHPTDDKTTTTEAVAAVIISPPETQQSQQQLGSTDILDVPEPEGSAKSATGEETARQQLLTPNDTQRDEDLPMPDSLEEDDDDSDFEHSFAAEQQIMSESQAYEASQHTQRETIEPTHELSDAGSHRTTRSKAKAKSDFEPLIGPQSLRSWEHRRSGSSIATDDDPSIALARAMSETSSRARAGEEKSTKGHHGSPPTVRVTRSRADDSDPSLELARAPRSPSRKSGRDATPEPRETRAMAQRARTKTPEPSTSALKSPSVAGSTTEPRETRARARKAWSKTPEPSTEAVKSPSLGGGAIEPRETRAMAQKARSKTPEPHTEVSKSPSAVRSTAESREKRAKAQKARSKTPESTAEVLKSPSVAGSATENEPASELKLKLSRTLRNDLPELSPLKSLRSLLNSTADFMGVATRTPKQPFRPKGGARDWMLEIPLTDPAAAPSTVCSATLFRPHQASLPVVSAGDVVLLRRVSVVSLKGRGFGVRSGDGSAWAVFEEDDEEMLPQIKGPPIEDISKEQIAYAEGLRKWWSALDDKSISKIDKATQKAVQKENS